MRYEEARAYMRDIQQGAKIKPGLETIGQLLEHLGNPQDTLNIVHIAGTNGKGSTAAFIESVLNETGKKVGRFVSPAVFEERETIRYTKKGQTTYITEEEFACHMTRIREAIQKMQTLGGRVPTEFEIETAIAFLAFQSWNCDVVLLEAGMGGRLDSTNVVRQPKCVVITPIAKDHTKFLGDTIEQIAMEKAGIIKQGVPVVTCQENRAVVSALKNVCKEKKAEFHLVKKEKIQYHEMTESGSVFSYENYQTLRVSMAGCYQVENACLALICLEVLQEFLSTNEKDIENGFAKAKWKGRFQVLDMEPPIVLDGAHNPSGMQAFCESAMTCFPDREKIAVMGVFADKEYDNMCQQLSAIFDNVFTVTAPSERGLPAEKLAKCLQDKGLKAVACENILQAVEQARAEAKRSEGVVFVVGSLSIIKEAYKYFT